MRVLFLGAGKRYRLLEEFKRAAIELDIDLDLYSIESDYFVPIYALANISIGPKFDDPQFPPYLLDYVQDHEIDIVIPNMDSACTALSLCVPHLTNLNVLPVVSSYRLCETMEDKKSAAEWFWGNGIPIPPDYGLPLIAKPRKGFGARGQIIIRTLEEHAAFMVDNPTDYYVQRYIEGADEYTVDAYVCRDKWIPSIFIRKRLEVESGEVMKSVGEYREDIDKLTQTVLQDFGWYGPITLQFLVKDDKPVILEVNPRFGGGVIHAIHEGVDMPKWVLQERLGTLVWAKIGPQGTSTMCRYRAEVFL